MVRRRDANGGLLIGRAAGDCRRKIAGKNVQAMADVPGDAGLAVRGITASRYTAMSEF